MSQNFSTLDGDVSNNINLVTPISEEKKDEIKNVEGIITPPRPIVPPLITRGTRLSGNPRTSNLHTLEWLQSQQPPPLPAWPLDIQQITVNVPTPEVEIKESPFVVVECKDCGDEFEFSNREREFLTKKVPNYDGKNPVRCKDCRKLKKSNPKVYQEKLKEKKEALEALHREERKADRVRRKAEKSVLHASEFTPEIVVEGDSKTSASSVRQFISAPVIPAQVCSVDDWKNPEPIPPRRVVPFSGIAYTLVGQAEEKKDGNAALIQNLPDNYPVPPIHNLEGKIREPIVRRQCTHDISGCCAICFLDQKVEADEKKAETIRLAAIALRIRSRNADRAARHVLGDFSSSDSSGGSSSSSSESESEPPPPEDVERPIRVKNYQGHYMFDNYENRNKTSETRVFEVPQACFHGFLSDCVHSETDLVKHYGFYYKTKKVSVEMPVSIVNELKVFWVTALARDKLNYHQCKMRAIHLMRNYDAQSKIYLDSVLFAPLLAFWETEEDHRGTNAIVNEKLWSWNYCFLLLFIYAFMEYLLFDRAFNPFWVSLLFIVFVALRFGGNVFIETEFMNFSRLKFYMLGIFGALYLFWFMLLTAATYTWQPTSTTIIFPSSTNNGTVIWSDRVVTYSNIGVYDGSLVFPLSLTCILLLIYYRITVLYTVSFLSREIHFRDDHVDWHVPVYGWRMVRSILPPSHLFVFIQMSLFYLYAPYYVGFVLYLVMRWVNRKFTGRNVPHNYRILSLDVQFY